MNIVFNAYKLDMPVNRIPQCVCDGASVQSLGFVTVHHERHRSRCMSSIFIDVSFKSHRFYSYLCEAPPQQPEIQMWPTFGSLAHSYDLIKARFQSHLKRQIHSGEFGHFWAFYFLFGCNNAFTSNYK